MPVNQENLQLLVEHLNTMKCGFVAINSYTNQLGEVSSRRINVGYSYASLKEQDLEVLRSGVEYIPSEKYTKADWDNAVRELIEGIVAPNQNRSNAQQNAYINLTDNGIVQYCPGTEHVYVHGLQLEGSKKIVEGTKSTKVVKSAPKTIAKNKIRDEYLKAGKIRKFTVYRLGEVKLKGDTLEIVDHGNGGGETAE